MSKGAGKDRYSVLVSKVGSRHHRKCACLCEKPLNTHSHKVRIKGKPGVIQLANLIGCRDITAVVRKLDLGKKLIHIKRIERLMAHSVYKVRQSF